MRRKILLFTTTVLVLIACTKEADELTSSKGKSGSITRFAVHNEYMYALDQNRVMVYSLSDPSKPQLINQVQTDYGLETITVYDGTVYVGSTSGLYILNISDPASPFITAKSERETLRGGCDPVVVKGHYAFSTVKIIANICGEVSVQSQLLVYDVSNQTQPMMIGAYDMNIPNGLGYKDDYLFVCDEGSDVVEIFDISNPESLTYYGSFTLTDPLDLIVDGDKMIVSAKTDFNIYNILSIDNIIPLGAIPY